MRPHLDASCRHDSLRSFLLLEHSVRQCGRCGSQQHQPFCTSRQSPQGAQGGHQPCFDMQSSARPWCERSLCTLGKRLSRRRVCSTQFCTRALSGRAQLTLAEKRTSCRRHCKRRPCSTLLQPSSSLQLCCPVLTRRNVQISLSEPIVPCASSRQPKKGTSRSGGGALASNATVSTTLSQATREGQVAPQSEWTAWTSE